MTVKELRIGNLIFDDFNEVHSVEAIKSGEFIEYNKNGIESIIFSKINGTIGMFVCDKVFPIPLTEEWLLKLGLVKYKEAIPYSYVFHLKKKFGYSRFRIQYAHYGDGSEGFYNLHLYNKQCKKVMYVHELQNLYFALMGEELEVTND